MYIYSMGRITTATKQPHCVSSYSLCPLTVNWQGAKGEGHARGKSGAQGEAKGMQWGTSEGLEGSHGKPRGLGGSQGKVRGNVSRLRGKSRESQIV